MVLAEHADLIFAISNVLFSVALIPSVWKRTGRNIPLTTSVMTGGLLYTMAATFADLGFPYTTLTMSVSASLWVVLMYQRLLYLRRYYGSFFPWVRDMVTRLRQRFLGR